MVQRTNIFNAQRFVEGTQTLATSTVVRLLPDTTTVLCLDPLLSSKLRSLDWVVCPSMSSARALLYTPARLCLNRPLTSSPMQKYSSGFTQLLKKAMPDATGCQIFTTRFVLFTIFTSRRQWYGAQQMKKATTNDANIRSGRDFPDRRVRRMPIPATM